MSLNRKNGTNSKAPLRDAMAEIEVDEYARLYKSSILNDANFTPEVYETMEKEISENIGRAVHFAPYRTKNEEGNEDTQTQVNLDLALLYKECHSQRNTEKIDIVLHKITKQSTDYTCLFKWRKFTQITQPFIKPVHFRLGAGRHLTTTLAINSTTPLTLLQNKLIQSHHTTNTLALAAFIEPLEALLDVVLTKAIFYRDSVFLFFEWTDAMPFIFVMSFLVYLPDSRRLAPHNAYILMRRDILPDPSSTVCTEEAEEEEEKEQDEMIIEEGKKILFIASDRADGDKMIAILKKNVSNVFISYITSGYIKRD